MGLPRSATAAVERLCERDVDERTLRSELVSALRTAVPFEDYAWLLTDPETTVGSAPLADVRCLAELPRLIGLRYRTTVNRWTSLTGAASLAQATPAGGCPCTLGAERPDSLPLRHLAGARPGRWLVSRGGGG